VKKLFCDTLRTNLLKLLIFACIFCSPIGLPLALAQSNTDVEKIFNWGEANFMQLFPNHQMTLTAGSWQYRFYPSTNIYIGTRDEQVFVFGGPFGNVNPSLISTVPDLLTRIGSDSGVPACKNPQDGFTATQSENVVNITSNGQCLAIPNDICEPLFSSASTGNSVLSTTTLTSTSLSGIEFDNPANAAAVQELLNAAENKKLCTLNTSTNSMNLVIHTDTCRTGSSLL